MILMKCLALLLPFFANIAFAEEANVSAEKPISISRALEAPTSFSIDNSTGNIQIYESQSSNLEISGQYQGSSQAKISVEDAGSGQLRVSVKYPTEATGSSGGIHISGGRGSIQIGNSGGISSISGNSGIVIRGGGSVIVNGQKLTPDVNGNISLGSVQNGEVSLRVGIPPRMMKDLEAQSRSGDVNVTGGFDHDTAGQHKIILNSTSGNVTCEGVCSRGAIKATSASGDIRVSRTTGEVRAKSVSGDVTAVGNKGNLNAESVSGDVRIEGQTGGTVEAKSVSGDVRLNNPGLEKPEIASTTSGRVSGRNANAGSQVQVAKPQPAPAPLESTVSNTMPTTAAQPVTAPVAVSNLEPAGRVVEVVSPESGVCKKLSWRERSALILKGLKGM